MTDNALGKRVALLEEELRQRNSECQKLMTENRVLRSHSEALKDTQRQLLLAQETAIRVQGDNETLRKRVLELEVELSRRAHNDRMALIRQQLEEQPAEALGGDAALLSQQRHVVNDGTAAPKGISSIGFGRTGDAVAHQSEEEQAEHLMRMAHDAVLLDLKHAELADNDDAELLKRFYQLQGRR